MTHEINPPEKTLVGKKEFFAFTTTGALISSLALGAALWLVPDTSGPKPITSAPCPALPVETIQETATAFNRDTRGLLKELRNRPRRPDIAPETHAYAANQRLREKLAKDYGVTLVGQRAVTKAMAAVASATSVPEIVTRLNTFTTKQFAIPTKFAKPVVEEDAYSRFEVRGFNPKKLTAPEQVERMQHSAQVIIQDLSAVPRELIAAAGITENLIASTMHSTTAEGTSGVGGTTYLGVKAPVYLAGEFRMGDEESSTPLHEYSHRWHIKACGDNITNDPQFTALNPRRGFEYGNEINGPYTAAEKAATVSQYSTSSLAEDFAETASAGIRTNFSYTGKPIVGQKQFVTMARINQIAPGAGSYLIAYSQAQDRTTGLEMPPFIPARAPE